jgi:hypothetical protein
MAALTNFLEDALIGHLFRGTPYVAPTTLYVGLLTAAPGEAGGGTEVAGNAYARVAVANSSAQWNAAAGGNGTTANTNVVTFPVPSAGWGVVTHFAVYDAAATGNMLWYSALTLSKTINSGDTVSFPAATITIQIDN